LRRTLLLGAGGGVLGSGWANLRMAYAGEAVAAAGPVFRLDQHGVVTAQRLDEVVAQAFPLFHASSVLPDFDAALQGGRNDVELYRLTTTVTVPETGEVVEVTGLLALPVGATGVVPVVSWQHGTILSFDQVPSHLTKLADAAT